MKYLLSMLLFLLIVSCKVNQEEQFDKETGQQEVLTKKGIDAVINQFEEISFSELDEQYKHYTDPEKKFRSALANKTYRIVRGYDIYKFVVGKYRVKNFLTTDAYYNDNLDNLEADYPQYWLVDKELLYLLLEIIQALDERGFDKYGFQVRESHRHPRCNEMRGGASLSQHIHGTAADLVAEDLNRDGKKNEEDKEILLRVAEGVVGNRGGVGKYPGSMTVHVDCRGYAARWNSY